MVNYVSTFKSHQIVNNFQTYELYLLHNHTIIVFLAIHWKSESTYVKV